MSEDVDTIAIHPVKKKGHGPMVEPIYMSSTWRLKDARQGADFSLTTAPPEFYTRWGNPTTKDLEQALAKIEGGKAAIATGSGMGAVSSSIMAFARPGANIVAGKSLYSATTEMLSRFLPQFRIKTKFVDTTRKGSFAKAVNKKTCMVFAETPANPTMELTDLREAARAAHSIGAPLLVDNTFATPVNQMPLKFGTDVVLHSVTKYLGGHTDVIAGAIVTKDKETFERIWRVYKLFGPTIGPFEAFLVRRGIKTLPLRVKRVNETAMVVAEFLENHRAVKRVHYPGLKSFPQRTLAKRQMKGFGGMLSFEVKGGYKPAVRFVEGVRVATLAVSLGGVETLVEHAASMTHGTLMPKERKLAGIDEGLIRVSVGLEATGDLIQDFDKALSLARR